MVALDGKIRVITKVITIHPVGNMNVCAKIAVETIVLKSLGCIIWEDMSVQTVAPIHLVNIEVFHWISEIFDLLVVRDEKPGVDQSQ